MKVGQKKQISDVGNMSKISNTNFWDEFGKVNNYNTLSSWEPLRVGNLRGLFISVSLSYRKALFTRKPEDLKESFTSVLTATGIVLSIIFISTYSSLGEFGPAINPENIFQESTEAFTYISKILGFLSFATSAGGTLYCIAFYSHITSIWDSSCSGYSDSLGRIFKLIWFFPAFSLGTYFGSITVKYILLNNKTIGIITVILSILIWGLGFYSTL